MNNRLKNSNNTSFIVKLKIWEGPLDLLLDLIQSAKIDIYEIEIATITNQYLVAIKYLKKLEITLAMDFIVMAATLIFLKSRALLPAELAADEEDGLYFYSKEKLIEQLIEYQKYKQAAGELESISHVNEQLIARKDKQIDLPLKIKNVNPANDSSAIDDSWQEVTLLHLIKVFANIVDNLEKRDIDSLKTPTYKIVDKLNLIKQKIKIQKKIIFWDLFIEQVHKLEIIVTFLAILELYKAGDITIKQHSFFGEIIILPKEG